MPFFSNRKAEEEVIEEPAPAPVPEKKHGLFGSRRRSPSPASTAPTRASTSSSHNSDAVSNPSRHRSVLSRTFGHGNGLGLGGSSNPDVDPSIVRARERVMGAEDAEREADRALEAARLQVREARDHVRRLELEAAEEARRAKIKQYHAREVSKRGKQLGRHDL
ncbi:putative eukaryotic translation initiation factor 3 subunit [Rosellinia necatrix]|uniref:Putative eukaryotic translation initiation factor 3 subunit n=1 Tax=Rosellinia necatrix TaxID=77044 RepID=A0A1W2TEZ8_ROSNE|nr:putative eukaryotic translation initiation factor 3 subunit [Rosellinia necatrix]